MTIIALENKFEDGDHHHHHHHHHQSDNDIREALKGLQLAASTAKTPPDSPPNETMLDAQGVEVVRHEREDDDGMFFDAVDHHDKEHRISQAEEQLLMVYAQTEATSESQRFLANKPNSGSVVEQKKNILPILRPHAYPCEDTYKRMPSPPSMWPQAPVMLRPTPNVDMVVRGIRRADSPFYTNFKGFCAGCILPINTGKEAAGESLVIDFESKHFVGSVLMRIKQAPDHSSAEGDNSNHPSYFDGKKRLFQAVVKGKFKTPNIAIRSTVTGQSFDRPAGRLPAKWIVSSFIKFVSTLAPQLEATIDGNQPRFLTPLCATAHTVLAKKDFNKKEEKTDDAKRLTDSEEKIELYCRPISSSSITTTDSEQDQERLLNYAIYPGASADIERPMEEPPTSDPQSLLQTVFPDGYPESKKPRTTSKSSVATRQKARKKVLNALAAGKLLNTSQPEPCFDLDTEYTFEFYQHLLLFDTFSVDMGMPIGKVPLAPALNGQPLKFMSAVRTESSQDLEYLWSFDIWHEALYTYLTNNNNNNSTK